MSCVLCCLCVCACVLCVLCCLCVCDCVWVKAVREGVVSVLVCVCEWDGRRQWVSGELVAHTLSHSLTPMLTPCSLTHSLTNSPLTLTAPSLTAFTHTHSHTLTHTHTHSLTHTHTHTQSHTHSHTDPHFVKYRICEILLCYYVQLTWSYYRFFASIHDYLSYISNQRFYQFCIAFLQQVLRDSNITLLFCPVCGTGG